LVGGDRYRVDLASMSREHAEASSVIKTTDFGSLVRGDRNHSQPVREIDKLEYRSVVAVDLLDAASILNVPNAQHTIGTTGGQRIVRRAPGNLRIEVAMMQVGYHVTGVDIPHFDRAVEGTRR
jgi:hypothetical protein